MELNLDSKQVERKVVLGGVTYGVTELKVGDQLEMKKALNGLTDGTSEHFEAMINFIAKAGIPSSVLYSMNGQQLKAFIEFISGSTEKKS